MSAARSLTQPRRSVQRPRRRDCGVADARTRLDRRAASDPVSPSPPPIRIRPARTSDLDALVELENGVFSSDRISARQLRHHLESSRARILVAMQGRDLVAAAVVFFRSGSADCKALLDRGRLRVREAGASVRASWPPRKCRRTRLGSVAFRLEVRTDNRAARTLYERRGYAF